MVVDGGGWSKKKFSDFAQNFFRCSSDKINLEIFGVLRNNFLMGLKINFKFEILGILVQNPHIQQAFFFVQNPHIQQAFFFKIPIFSIYIQYLSLLEFCLAFPVYSRLNSSHGVPADEASCIVYLCFINSLQRVIQ